MNDLKTRAFEKFDSANAEDPNLVEVNGVEHPKELVFARRLTACVLELNPEASEILQLASRCQHICRWEVPRRTEPMGRAGYLKWRAGLKKFHASKSAEILRDVGYAEGVVLRVQELNLKKSLKSDHDCQTLEDALCLVFLKYQFDDLIARCDHEKMIRLTQKTWSKMSPQGQAVALKLDYSSDAQAILAQVG